MPMERKELAGMLEYAADLMEVLGEGDFRARAYRSAARNLERLDQDLDLLAENGFKGVPGIGSGLAPMLSEIVQSGEFAYLAELEGRIPPGVLELFGVQGLGPKRIRALWDSGIGSLEELIRRAEEGQLRSLPGFGAKSEASLLEAARFAQQNLQRTLLPVALEAAELLLFDLRNAGFKAELAGSLRRGLETIGNLDIVAQAKVEKVVPLLGRYLEGADGHVLFGRFEGMALRVFCTEAPQFGTVWLRATGSAEWLKSLPKLPQDCPSEEAVFAALGQPWVPPYWREPQHIGRSLPAQPLQLEQLKGLIHCHSTYSDASGTLRQMAEAAIAHGYAYMVISDHSQTAYYANGLKPADLERQWAEIETLNQELAPFRILRGIESDILPDGSLDYPDSLLAQFEVVIGSLHANLGLEPTAQTQRLLKALDNPYLSILGHPSGRLVLRRKGAEADWEAVLQRAAERGKVVEFNCNAHRLDLDWRLMLQWRDRLNFCISTDAHSLEGLEAIGLGLLFGNKAGLSPQQVVNTWSPEQLLTLKQHT